MDDLISRQSAIDAVGNMLRRKFGIGGDLASITLAGLPSAQPERCEDCVNFSKRREEKRMRLIDADALLKEVENEQKYLIARGQLSEEHILVHSLKRPVLDAPTVDAVERKHGRWMFSPDDAEGVCTVCQYKIYGRPYQGHYLIVPYNFCPNCGAEME